MDGFWILRCLKKRFDVLILNKISKFSKTKNLTKKIPIKVTKSQNGLKWSKMVNWEDEERALCRSEKETKKQNYKL